MTAGLFLRNGKETAYAQLPTERPARVAANTVVTVAPSKPSVSQGEEFDIIVSISTMPEDSTTVSQFQLLFDPRYVEITGFEEGNFYKDWALAHGIDTIIVPEPEINNEAGLIPTFSISLLGYLPDEIVERVSGSGNLMIFHAKAKDREGSAELKLEDVVVSDFPPPGNRTDLKAYEGVKIQNGVVAVGGAPVEPIPEAELIPTATKPPSLVERPTVEVVTPQAAIAESTGGRSNSGGFNSAWLLAIPVVGAIIIGAVVVFSTRKR
jgi:hypothetical protein